MIVDETGRLQERIGDHWTEEFEASVFEVSGKIGGLGTGHTSFSPGSMSDLSIDETPGVFREAAGFFLDHEKYLGIRDGGFNLQTIPDDACVLHEPSDIAGTKTGDALGIETGESLPIVFTTLQDGLPRQSGLSALEEKELEESRIVSHGLPPFSIMVALIKCMSGWHPGAALFVGILCHTDSL